MVSNLTNSVFFFVGDSIMFTPYTLIEFFMVVLVLSTQPIGKLLKQGKKMEASNGQLTCKTIRPIEIRELIMPTQYV